MTVHSYPHYCAPFHAKWYGSDTHKCLSDGYPATGAPSDLNYQEQLVIWFMDRLYRCDIQLKR